MNCAKVPNLAQLSWHLAQLDTQPCPAVSLDDHTVIGSQKEVILTAFFHEKGSGRHQNGFPPLGSGPHDPYPRLGIGGTDAPHLSNQVRDGCVFVRGQKEFSFFCHSARHSDKRRINETRHQDKHGAFIFPEGDVVKGMHHHPDIRQPVAMEQRRTQKQQQENGGTVTHEICPHDTQVSGSMASAPPL
jgi:hypothetical protein